jgi:FtsP/CotA-like multicopper oxidase with cupredoxin domain
MVTQMPIPPGGTFDADFVAGPLIVDDPDEPALIAAGVLPASERVLVLSDVGEYQGRPFSAEVDNATEIMNGTEGDHLLVNGREEPVLELPAGEATRLRVINTSITRFWRLAVPGHVLYRVGGEGGLLDAVRVEGGDNPMYLGYDRGEILLGPGERADLVLVPDGQRATSSAGRSARSRRTARSTGPATARCGSPKTCRCSRTMRASGR